MDHGRRDQLLTIKTPWFLRNENLKTSCTFQTKTIGPSLPDSPEVPARIVEGSFKIVLSPRRGGATKI